MPIIYDRRLVGKQLKTGIKAIANYNNDVTIARSEEDLASMLRSTRGGHTLDSSTIKSWKYKTPSFIDDDNFYGIIGLVLKTGRVDLDWLEQLLAGTSVPFAKPISAEWLEACLKQARLDGKPLPQTHIDTMIEHFFPEKKNPHSTNKGESLLQILVPLKPETQEYIRSASAIAVEGISLYRFIEAFYHDFAFALQSGTALRVLLVDPSSSAVDMIAFRSTSRTDANMQQKRINNTLASLNRLAENVPGASIETRLLDYMPPYGITTYQHQSDPEKSLCHVRLFTFRTPTPSAPLIAPNPVRDMYWFKFFSDQFDLMWDAAKER